MPDEVQDEELDGEASEVADEDLPQEVQTGAQAPSRRDVRQSAAQAAQTERSEEPREQKPAQEQVAAPPTTVMVDGKEVPLDEVMAAYRQRGSQQQDYQKKTSELADQRRQLERALGQRLAGTSDQAPSREAQPVQPAARIEARPPADVVSMMGELLLDKEIRGVREAYGEVDESALVEIMAETGLDGKEAYIHLVGRNTLRQGNQATAETTTRGILNRSRVAEGSSSRLAATTQPMTPDEAGKKSWAALAEEGRSDLQRRGGKILSSE